MHSKGHTSLATVLYFISKWASRILLVVLSIFCLIILCQPFLQEIPSAIFNNGSYPTGYKQIVDESRLLAVRNFDIKPTYSNLQICDGPKTNVAFLKVHKAGSTTVMNIFLRFGETHNLNVVLPKSITQGVFNYLGYGTTIQKSRINKIPGNESYNIICNHAVYSKKVVKELLGPNAVNIGIIRDPFTHFPSAAMYYGLSNKIRKVLNIKQNEQRILSLYLQNPDAFPQSVHTHNGMFLDFGLSKSHFENETAINNHLLEIDRDFSLVMIMEHFDESLVLMKRILCWELKDILYVPLNINKKKQKNPLVLSEDDKKKLFKYNYADFKLYYYFKTKFIKQVRQEGETFKSEVAHFKTIHKLVTEYCHKQQKLKFSGSDILQLEASQWNSEFNMTPGECKFMMTPELTLLRQLIDKADKRYNKWWTDTHLKNKNIKRVHIS